MSESRKEITRRLLSAALKKLMTEKPLHEITVREITDVCGVHRQTFYYHFKDIYELLNWTFTTELANVFKGEISSFSWQQKLLQILDYLEKNKAACICALESLGRETLSIAISVDLHAVVREVVKSYKKESDDDEKEISFITDFFLSAVVGIIERWLLGEINLSAAEIVTRIEKIVLNQVRGAGV